jgi:hypothetical protein
VFEQMASDPDPGMRAMVATNSASPPAVLERLARDPVEETRAAVAGNPSSSPTVLEQSVRDPEFWVRLEAARNPSCPPAVLRLLLDSVGSVRAAAADNPELPADLRALWQLAHNA